MKTRHEIKEFINKIEQNYPVDKWTIDGVHIWPYGRIKLFFALIAEIEDNHNEQRVKQAPVKADNNKGLIQSKIDRLRNSHKVLKFEADRRLRKIPSSEVLIATSFTHRTEYKGGGYNKFADPVLDHFGDGINLEISQNHLYNRQQIHNKKRVFFFYDYFNAVIKSDKRKLRIQVEKQIQLPRYEDFIAEVISLSEIDPKRIGISIDHLIRTIDRFHDFAETYELILDNVKPKVVYTVCFYTFSIMALNYVAKKRGIRTIEIQHGPQSEVHMGYASWMRVPTAGFNTMPKYFWNWDKYSHRVISNWTCTQDHHKCFVAGNPWVNYLDRQFEDKKVVLYSLQNLKFEYLFPEYILNEIRSEKYEWWIRLHPRQLEYLDDVEDFFKKNYLDDKVNIVEASNEPLPVVLSKTNVHVTNFSGCTLEASYFGIPTLLIDERGRDAFGDLIKEAKATYCKDGLLFSDLLSRLYDSSELNSDVEVQDWTKIIEQLND